MGATDTPVTPTLLATAHPEAGADAIARWARLPLDILRRADVTPAAKMVYMALADRIGANGQCWPGQRRIAADCGLCLHTVNRAIAELAAAELVDVNAGRFDGPKGGRSSHYRLRPTSPNVAEGATLQKVQRCKNGTCNVAEGARATLQKVQHNQTSEPNQGTNKRGSADSWIEVELLLPPNSALRSTVFRAAWERWASYWREIHKAKALAPSTVREQLEELERFGHDKAVCSIKRSIKHGWSGLFDPDDKRPLRGDGGDGSNIARLASPANKYDALRHGNRRRVPDGASAPSR